MTSTLHFMCAELVKMANAPDDDVSSWEAARALQTLRKLEREKPTIGELGRGAIAGSAAGLASRAASSLADGSMVRGIADSVAKPGMGNKVTSLAGKAATNIGATVAGSAAFGTTLPFVRRTLDREAEKEKLRRYLDQTKGGKIRRMAARAVD